MHPPFQRNFGPQKEQWVRGRDEGSKSSCEKIRQWLAHLAVTTASSSSSKQVAPKGSARFLPSALRTNCLMHFQYNDPGQGKCIVMEATFI
mmetsp:Transcript_16447/g.29230  ORF Transcript_16447/g.29230 Transcript_16447/m.29230 type:complete len:91 (-) Transcript_16447:2481-2753(-)